jgi:hypothetical protein
MSTNAKSETGQLIDSAGGFSASGSNIERHRGDHRSSSKPAEDSDEPGGHCHPADEKSCEEQRRLRKKAPAKRFEHAPSCRTSEAEKQLDKEIQGGLGKAAGWRI